MKSALIIGVSSLILMTLQFRGIHAKRPSTCRDLRQEIKSHKDEIKNLSLTLEEYRLVRGEKEYQSDECNGYNACSNCLLQGANPSCGWCVLHNRCSIQENCRGGSSGSNLWITGIERCPKIRAVKPPRLPIQKAEMLQIIMVLPEYDGMFLCSFEVLGNMLLTKGWKINTTEGGVMCATPFMGDILENPINSVHVPVKLSVRIPYGSNLASTSDFTFYNCDRYESCSECTASPFPCAWCVDGNKCTHSASAYCRGDIIIFSKAVSRASIRVGPVYCPRVLPHPSMPSNEILVHSGSAKRITLKVESLVQYQVQSRFLCNVNGDRQVIGQLLADNIYCNEMTFKVLDQNPITKLPFAIIWDGRAKLDNIQNLHVVVYDCGLLANSCSECLDLSTHFNCGWCDETNSCTVQEGCGESAWMEKGQKCTKPKITSFYPKSGLLTRKTNITIKGINFGREIGDIDRIKLLRKDGSIITECKPFTHLKNRSTPNQINCELGIPEIGSEGDEIIQGFFELKIADKFGTTSDEDYTFVNPSLTAFEPAKGLKSGGTFLKIEGHNLDAGSKVEVFIADLPCNITSRDSMTIRCITSPSPTTMSSGVKVVFDGEERKLSTYYFYVEDPYIRSVKSGYGVNDPVGTQSGGNLVVIDGENFDHVPNPYIYIIVDGVEYPGSCVVESDKTMKCSSPRLPADVLNFCDGEGYLTFDYGFRMGDVRDVQNISLNRSFEKFRIYPDPFFMPFAEKKGTRIYESDYLTISGRNLEAVFDEGNITVHIGEEECIVTSLSATQLVCRPPAVQPKARGGDGTKLPEVVVRIQEKQEFFIGFLQYSDK